MPARRTVYAIRVLGLCIAATGAWLHAWWLVAIGVVVLAWGWGGRWVFDRLRTRRSTTKQDLAVEDVPPAPAPTPRPDFAGVTTVGSMDDFEDPASAKHLVVVCDGERLKWLRFMCPCGCGETIALNLMRSHSPRWTVERHDDGTLSVTPSVDSTTCGSHFWIRRSRIAWV